MKIGIDFDNTIAIYDELFRIENNKYNFTEYKNSNPKEILKRNLFKKNNGIFLWNKIQGSIYGRQIKNATIAPGFKSFLILAKYLKHEVFIISHKTKYGHFDKKKFNLRTEAIKWMDKNNLFLKNNLLIKKKNIFFCNTKKEKIDKLNSLHLDYFVDDLLKILIDKTLTNKTNKIFFNRFNSRIKNNYLISLSNWSIISNHIHKVSDKKRRKILCSSLISKKIKSFRKYRVNGNSNIYKLRDINNKFFIAKFFPNNNYDNNRIKNEIKAINFLKNKLNTPKIVKFSLDENIVIYNFIDGSKLSFENVYGFINIIKKLKKISSGLKYNSYTPAVESCLNINQLFHQIEERITKIKNFNKTNKKLLSFLSILKYKYYYYYKKKVSFESKNKNSTLSKKHQILSQSDFGFHNAMFYNKSIFLYDFEYFGWDDPVKLVSDFIWHPQNKLTNKNKNLWIDEMLNIFSKDLSFKKRLKEQFNLYGIRWILIILNIYHPNKFYIKKIMYENIKSYNKIKIRQLNLAKKYMMMLNNSEKNIII